ncbi:MAG: hypothetical protein PHE25_00105 [Candidatus Gracilibacteria bacterium]|nr:hypothetical protein [Candidatus Gracilibacteria bacterium]
MKNFKVEVSKGLEKYNLIKKAESEKILRDELHNEGFAVLTVLEIGELEVSGNKFFFEILQKDGTLKVGTIVSNDIFKAYLKIKYELKYDLMYLYKEKDTTIDEKKKIILELEIHYKIYLESNKKDIEEKLEKDQGIKKIQKEESIDGFQMKKELDYVYQIIDKVLIKLKNIIEKDNEKILGFEKKEKLKNLYSEIIKLKNSTNIQKLKQIGELALTKIGELELQVIETKKSEEYIILLSDTNKLLKQIGSKKVFIEKDKDLNFILKNLFNDFFDLFKQKKDEKIKKEKVDTTSTGYLKNKYLLTKYQNLLELLKKEKLKHFYVYIIPTKTNSEKVQYFILKEKVINQNIVILKGRITGGIFSYVKIVKGYKYFIKRLLDFLEFFKMPMTLIIFTYSCVFLIVNLLNSLSIIDNELNFNGIFYFIYLAFILVLLKFTRGIFSLIFNIVIFCFLFIFGVVNF